MENKFSINKNFRLSNERVVKLCFISTKDDFLICALNDSGTSVGKCRFEIIDKTIHPLNKRQLQKFSHHYNEGGQSENPLFLVKEKNVNNGETRSYITTKRPQTPPTSDATTSSTKVCKLQSIEVLSDEFFKVGLGSAMFKEMEKFAKTQNCTQIEAWFSPYGNFWSGSQGFYTKNGFKIEKDENGTVFATKEIVSFRQKI